MTNSQRLSTVRDQLIRWIAEQNVPPAGEDTGSASGNPILSESILIRDGFYCGRRFDLGSHRAVWFLEEDVLKIYSSQGELVCVLTSEQLGKRAAADDCRGQVFTLPSQAERSPVADQPSASALQRPGDSDQSGEIRRAA